MEQKDLDRTANQEHQSSADNARLTERTTMSSGSDTKPSPDASAGDINNALGTPAKTRSPGTESHVGDAAHTTPRSQTGGDSRFDARPDTLSQPLPTTASKPLAGCDCTGQSRTAPALQKASNSGQGARSGQGVDLQTNSKIAIANTTGAAGSYEQRLSKLEAKIMELQSCIQLKEAIEPVEDPMSESSFAENESENGNDRNYSQYCRALPRINFMTVEYWDKRTFSLKRPHPALDVVVSSKPRSDSSNEGGEQCGRFDGLDLKFIQLNSIPALHAWFNLVRGTVDQAWDFSMPMIILAPFKNLTEYADELRSAYNTLELKWCGRGAAVTDVIMRCYWCSDDTPSGDTALKKHDRLEASAASQCLDTGAHITEKEPKSSKPTSSETSGERLIVLGSADAADETISGTETRASDFETNAATMNADEGAKEDAKASRTDLSAESVGEELARTPEAAATQLTATRRPPVPGQERYRRDALHQESYDACLGLKTLLHFYTTFVEPRWNKLRSKSPEEVGNVEFRDLCELFQPGDDVYAADEPQRVWRVIRVTGGRQKLPHFLNPASATTEERTTDVQRAIEEEKNAFEKWTDLRISGYYLDYDGCQFGPSGLSHTIKYYPGARPIRGLTCWPLRFADEPFRDKVTEHGRLFVEKCVPGLHRYEGRPLNKSPQGLRLFPANSSPRRNITSQIYVDPGRAFQHHSEWAPSFELDSTKFTNLKADSRELDFEQRDFKDRGSKSNLRRLCEIFRLQSLEWPEINATTRALKKESWIHEDGCVTTSDPSRIEPHDQTLLPNRLFGFILQSREWACFDIDPSYLKESPHDETAWNELQLDEDHKRSLMASVEFHFRNNRAIEERTVGRVDFDFINGKGQGLVVLLHGPPGLGKTTTAESIAMKYNKPLIPITCGNLGIEPQTVENFLKENFQLAQAWDGIILLDEADVFVARRMAQDLQRNALVSIFLRALEYYTGVLILTTNRIGEFDEALLSRVSLNLYYPLLNLEKSRKIWFNNLKRVTKLNPRRPTEHRIELGGKQTILDWADKLFHYRRENKLPVWNGHQIRIAFQNAVALAFFATETNRRIYQGAVKPAVLMAEHFQGVLNQYRHSEDYMKATLGFTSEKLMDRASLRKDSWGPPTPSSEDHYPSPALFSGKGFASYDEQALDETDQRPSTSRSGPTFASSQDSKQGRNEAESLYQAQSTRTPKGNGLAVERPGTARSSHPYQSPALMNRMPHVHLQNQLGQTPGLPMGQANALHPALLPNLYATQGPVTTAGIPTVMDQYGQIHSYIDPHQGHQSQQGYRRDVSQDSQ